MKILINFSDFDLVEIGTVNSKRVLNLKKHNASRYFLIPACCNYIVSKDSISFTCTLTDSRSLSIFSTFNNSLEAFLNSNQSFSKKKLLLKGLGFRFTFDEVNKNASFKLGYSHLTTLEVPSYIKQIKMKKNTILVESSDKILLGDYIEKIYKLRKADSYKGKGFSYQYDNKKLKVIKKK